MKEACSLIWTALIGLFRTRFSLAAEILIVPVVRPVRRRVTPAHPCSATDVFELDFNNSRMSEARGEGVALRTRQHGQDSLVGSSRSPFHNTVLPRRSRRGRPIPNAHRPKADEDVTVDGIAVTDDVTR